MEAYYSVQEQTSDEDRRNVGNDKKKWVQNAGTVRNLEIIGEPWTRRLLCILEKRHLFDLRLTLHMGPIIWGLRNTQKHRFDYVGPKTDNAYVLCIPQLMLFSWDGRQETMQAMQVAKLEGPIICKLM